MSEFLHDFELGLEGAEGSGFFVVALDGDQTAIVVFAQIDSRISLLVTLHESHSLAP